MEAQHEEWPAALEQARQLTAHWQAAPVPQAGTELATALTRLGGALTEHLDEEEAGILPLVRDHITVADGKSSAARGSRRSRQPPAWSRSAKS